MADSKITALTSIGTITDPAVDPLVVVDVSDTSMAASGTTKKVTLNQLLATSPTATLASATITGDLTVATTALKVDSANDRVGFGTVTPLNRGHLQGTGQATITPTVTGDGSALSLIDSGTSANNGGMMILGSIAANGNFGQVAIKSLLTNGLQNGTSALGFFTRAAVGDTTLGERYRIAQDGVATWSNVGGVAGTAMTLNSTGLGVGGSPAGKITAVSNASVFEAKQLSSGAASYYVMDTTVDASGKRWRFGFTGMSGSTVADFSIYNQTDNLPIADFKANGNVVFNTGNVGIGVTPSAWNTAFRGIDISTGGAIAGSSDSVRLFSNSAFNTAGNNVYKNAATAGRYDIQGNVHTWNISTNTPSAGGTITFTPAMTLDASGNLLVGTTDTGSNSGIGIKSVYSSTAPYVATVGSSTSASQYSYLLYSTGGTPAYKFYVSYSGQISATSGTVAALSDARFKENVQDIDVGLGAILALKPRKFDWKAGKGKDIKGDRGFIAQEFEQVFPQLVDEWKDPAPEGEAPYKSVRQDLIPVLVKAIQELAAEVNALKNA
jgi:hypothetical protein